MTTGKDRIMYELTEAEKEALLVDIYDTLWPGPDEEWDSETVDKVAQCFIDSDVMPPDSEMTSVDPEDG